MLHKFSIGELQHREELGYNVHWPHGVACGTSYLYVVGWRPGDIHIHNWEGLWVGRLEQPDSTVHSAWIINHEKLILATGASGIHFDNLRAYQVRGKHTVT
jgi:hypothetical protein